MSAGRSRKLGSIRTPPIILTVVSMTACLGEEESRPSALSRFDVWDSAGVAIAQSSGEVLGTSLPWIVGETPSLILGDHDGAGPTQFHRLRGITELGNGEIVIVDAGSRELRWFDREGQHIRTMGGEGDGPGEFRQPLLVPQFEGDSLLIFDTRLRRFTWVAEDGSGHRAQAATGNAQVLAGAATAAQGPRVLFLSRSAQCLMEDYCEAPLSVRWVDLTVPTIDTLAQFLQRSARTMRGDTAYIIGGPFDPVVITAPGPDGPVIGGGPHFELKLWNREGDLANVFRIDAVTRRSDGELLERVIRRYEAQGSDGQEVRRIFAAMDLPRRLPAFQSLAVDGLGWHWAEKFRLDDAEPSQWVVFDPEGRARGTVILPSGLEVHEIGSDYILGRWVDGVGVEYVKRYGLDRGSG